MKKKMIALLLCSAMALTMFAGCGKDNGGSEQVPDVTAEPIGGVKEEEPETENSDFSVPEDDTAEEDETAKAELEQKRIDGILTNDKAPAGKVFNELSGLLIDESLKDQRPIAVMVDNEITAQPHFGLNNADIIFEMVNSTKNDRVTRLMAVVKDWKDTKQLGNVRSARTTNCILAAEFNAVLCHDGGPYPIPEFSDFMNSAEVDHLSGVFSRIDNGKAREFTEYVTSSDLASYITNSSSISETYNQYYTGEHFKFVESDPMSYNNFAFTFDAQKRISLPFYHNKSELKYNSSTGKYDYYVYGSAHLDGATGEQLSFDNLIVLLADIHEYGEGSLRYYLEGRTGVGYYINKGVAAPLTWSKGEKLTDNIQLTDSDGNQVVIQAGKTYFAIVPSDSGSEIVIE